ncbi:MAG: 50S ribosomal protein L32 [Acidobacteriota bacterium]
MANPKRRTSKARRNRRRAHDALVRPGSSLCPDCGEVKRPHRVCLSCGTYRGRDIIEPKDAL